MATLTGTTKNDSITGTSGRDVIDGGAGNDSLSGGDGSDLLIAGTGNDEVDGGTGDDVIYGGTQTLNATGSGNDHLSGGAGNDTIYGGDGNDEIDGGTGNDTLLGETGNDHISGGDGNDTISGGDGNDELQGDAGNDSLSGGAGNDQLQGADGNDTLTGDAGNDTLEGGSGNDVLSGGLGADKLSGGSGNDIYAFNATNESKATASGGFDSGAGDTITGFASAADGSSERDKIDLTGLAASAGHVLTWSGTTATSYGVWYATSGGVTYVYVDTTGNAVADTAIKINSTEALSAADFLGLSGGDTTPPAITSVAYGDNDGTLKAGDQVTLIVTFSENVNVAGGTPSLTLNSGGTATYTSGSGGNTLVFTYVVGEGDNAGDLAVTGLTLNSATIRDAAGNNALLDGAATNPGGTLVVDTQGPDAGTLSFSGLDDTGSSGADGITSDNSFTLSISGNELNSTVTYQVSKDGGDWTDTTVNQPALADGSYQFRAKVSDAAGNVSYSGPQSVQIDTHGPEAGTLSLGGFDDLGSSDTDGLTKDNSFTLSLAGNEEGASVAYQVSFNGGGWISADTAQNNLADGDYEFRAVVTDAAGNESYSNVQSVTIDTQAPDFSVTLGSIADNDILSSLESKQPVEITGTLAGEFQDGAAVTVTVNGVDYQTTVSNGGFSVMVAGSDLVDDADRTVHVSVSTADDAGNVSSASADRGYTVSVEGVVADGYIAGATVFADANGNGELDADEVNTITDEIGNFQLVGGSGRLVLQGGTDISTGIDFTGTMTALAGSTAITPLTTMLVTLTDATGDAAYAESLLKTSLGLGDVSTPLASYDPVQAVLAGEPGAAEAMTSAVLLQNTITQAVTLLTATDTNLSEAEARAAVLEGIAQQLVTNDGSPLDLTDSNVIGTVIQSAATTTGTDVPPEVVQAAAQLIDQVNTAANDAVNAGDPVALLTTLAQVQIVVENTVTTLLQSGDADTIGSLSGTELTAAIDDARDLVGDVDGGAITGTEFAEPLTGTGGDDSIFGLAGDDTISGDAGNDLMAGGQGDDTLEGGAGNDVYVWNIGDGNDTVITTDGDRDVVRLNGSFYDYDWHLEGNDLVIGGVADGSYTPMGGVRIQDFLAGGDGIDYVQMDLGYNGNEFNSPGAGVSKLYFSVGTGEDQGFNTETIVGTAGDDVMTDAVGQGLNVFWSGDGNDTITAAAGTFAKMIGGDGNDVLNGSDVGNHFRGGAGNDIMNGGASGDDLVRYEYANGSDQFTHGVFVNLSGSDVAMDFNGATPTVAAGHALDNWGDTDTLNGIENARGSDFDDILVGSDGANMLEGRAGNDVLLGGGGNDDLHGGAGNDIIRAGGTDGNGLDFVTGDGGADTFVFGMETGETYINDFQLGLDNLELVDGVTIASVFQDNNSYGGDPTTVLTLSSGATVVLYGVAGVQDVGDLLRPGIVGTENADTLTGTSAAETITGLGGDDTLIGNGGDDVYVWSPGQGNDTIITTDGEHDVIRVEGTFFDYDWDFEGNDLLLTVVTDDSYSWDESLRIKDFLAGGDGIDYMDVDLGEANQFYSPGSPTSQLHFSAVDGEDQGNTNELILGTSGDDFMTDAIGEGFNVFWAGDGNDTVTAADGTTAMLIGGRGDDVLNGSDARGIFRGGSGDDIMNAGTGEQDLVRYDRKDGSGAFSHGVFVNLSDTEQTADFNGGPTVVEAGHAFDNWGNTDTLNGIEQVRGSDFADIIIGSSGNNELDGQGGDDTIAGGGGYDYLLGGDGNDVLIGGAGIGSLDGGNGDDILDGTAGSFYMSGGAGDDQIFGGSASEFINGGAGDDVISAGGTGDGEVNFVWGDDGSDTFVFGADAGDTHIEDFVVGTDFLALADNVTITDVDEQVWDAPWGPTTILSLSNGATVTLVSVAGITDESVLFPAQDVVGTPDDDILYGTNRSETFIGGTGDDALISNGGDDTFVWNPGDGNDNVFTHAGEQAVIQINGTFYDYNWFVDGNDLVVGVTADDSYDFNTVGGSLRLVDFLDGSDGIAYLQADLGDNNGFYNPGGGDVSKIYFNAINGEDQGSGYEVILGTTGDDVMEDAGGSGQNRFWGGDGNDTMTAAAGTSAVFLGGNGDDTMTGADGDDILRGAAGNDVMDGGDGSDLAMYFRPSGSEPFTRGAFVNLSDADATAVFNGFETTVQAGHAHDNWGDTDTLLNIENVRGSNFDDIIIGNAAGNVIEGMGGNDVIRGGGSGAGETDVLNGGGGADTFVFGTEAGDTYIADFELGVDYLKLEDGVTILSAVDTQDGDTLVTLDSGATITLAGITGVTSTDDLLLPPDIVGTPGDDTLVGSEKPDTFIGGTGDDTLTGNGGVDTYVWSAGDGHDTIFTTAGEKDVIQIVGQFYDYDWHVDGNDLVVGVFADDSYTDEGNLRIKDFFAGGDGIDYMVANVDPNNQYPTGNRFYMSAFNGEDQGNQFEWVIGNDGSDVMTGGGGAIDRLIGLGGNDTLSVSDGTRGILLGGDGDDTLLGADQNDSLRGGDGNDSMDGGAGDFDEVVYMRNFTSSLPVTSGVFVNLSSSSASMDFNGTPTTVEAGHALDNWGSTDTITNVEVVYGSNFSDIIIGSDDTNYLNGQDGDDTLISNGGNDYVSGGGGNDLLIGGAGNVYMSGGSGDDVLQGGAGSSTLQGDDGDDQIFGGSASDWISGGAGDDVISAGGTGDGEVNFVWGDDGSDTFVFGADAGDTHIEDFVVGVDHLSFGNGVHITGTEEQNWGDPWGPTTILSLSNGAYVALVSVSGVTNVDDLLLQKTITGTAADDVLAGTAVAETFVGGTGDDTMTGNGGDDVYVWSPGQGDDTIITTDGERDVIRVEGTFFDYDWDFDSNDLRVTVVTDGSYTWTESLTIKDFFAGGDGLAYMDVDLGQANEFYSPDSATSHLYFNTITGEDQGNNNEAILGTSADDVMTDVGGSGFNMFWAGDGSDTITAAEGTVAMLVGGRGNDVLNGSDARGIFRGGSGNDIMNAGAGDNDLVRYESKSGSDPFSHGVFVNLSGDAVAMDFNGGNPTVAAGHALDNWGDTDTLNGIENVRGSDFADIIVGSDGANQIEGLGGDDTLIGGAGNDYLFGGDGNDLLIGGNDSSSLNGDDGDDQIFGGSASDWISGGAGDDVIRAGGASPDEVNFVSGDQGFDTFVFGADAGDTHIEDFELGVDRLQLADGVTVLSAEEQIWDEPWGPTTVLALSNGATVSLVSVDGVQDIGDLFRLAVTGTAADDVLAGTALAETFVGGTGDDTMTGDGGDDVYVWNLGDGNDIIVTTDGEQDVIRINGTFFDYDWSIEGNDLVVAVVNDDGYTWEGSLRIKDFLAGGDGIDYMDVDLGPANQFYSPGSLTSLLHFSVVHGEDQGNTNELIVGTSGADNMTDDGGQGVNVFWAGDGNDTMTAAAGTFAKFIGGTGDDVMTGTDAGAVFRGGAGDDTMNGGTGSNDLARYERPDGSGAFSHGAFVNLSGNEVTMEFNGTSTAVAAGHALDNWDGTDTLTGIENVRGSNFSDIIVGSDDANRIEGLGGDDQLFGGGGSDSFVFHNLNEGTDTINDFTAGDGGDMLDFSDLGFADAADALAHGQQVDADVVFTLDSGTTVVLAHTDYASLTDSNFLI